MHAVSSFIGASVNLQARRALHDVALERAACLAAQRDGGTIEIAVVRPLPPSVRPSARQSIGQ